MSKYSPINAKAVSHKKYICTSGFIQCKVQNEQELIEKLRAQFTNYTIRGVQIDLLTIIIQHKTGVQFKNITVKKHFVNFVQVLYKGKYKMSKN